MIGKLLCKLGIHDHVTTNIEKSGVHTICFRCGHEGSIVYALGEGWVERRYKSIRPLQD